MDRTPKLPSDKLKQPRRPWVTGAVVAAVVVAGGTVAIGVQALAEPVPLIPRAHYAAPVNSAPVAQFTTSKKNLTVTVDASSSYDPDGEIVAYLWDLGDGTTSTDVKVKHKYAKPGTYTVTLTITDDGVRPLDGITAASVKVKKPAPPPPAPATNSGGGGGGYTYGNYPPGAVVPFLPGTNAPDTSACASSSASTVNGVAVCD